MTAEERARARQAAGQAAVNPIEGGVIGLGTGDSAAHAIRALAARARAGLRVTCVATSRASAELARAEGLRVLDPDDVPSIDLTIDGADELDPALQLLKGGGGALTREKLVARASARVVIVADEDKRVPRLGATRPLPVELLAFGSRWTLGRLHALGLSPALRLAAGAPFVTDGGGHIADCALAGGIDLAALARALDATSGVVEHGLFLTEARAVYIGRADGTVELLTRG